MRCAATSAWAGAAAPDFRAPQNPFDDRASGAKANLYPFGASPWPVGPRAERIGRMRSIGVSRRRLGHRRLGAFREEPGRAWAGLHPHPQLFPRGRREVGRRRSSRRCTSRTRPRWCIPAHTLKGEARQFGAEPLADVAELIEPTARFCIETHRFPDELVPEVVELRRLFEQTVELFDKATNPLVTPRRAGAASAARSPTRVSAGSSRFARLPTEAGCSSAAPSARSSRTGFRACRHAASSFSRMSANRSRLT